MPDETVTMDQMLAAFGKTAADIAPAADTKPEDTTTPDQSGEKAPEGDPNSKGDSTQNTTDSQKDEQSTASPDAPLQDTTKANRAFAEMRTQNKQQQEIIKGVAEVLGIKDVSNSQTLLETVQQAVLQSKAKQQNIDPEVLQRLQTLENERNQLATKERERTAYLGFQRLKDRFALDDKGLQTFANTLAQDGLNPFEQEVDLEGQYVRRNLDTLLSQAEEKGIQKERERAKKASEQGTAPNKYNGATQGDPPKVNSITDLNEFFNSHGVK